MIDVNNFEFDFSELDTMSDFELDLFFSLVINQNSMYLSMLEDPDFIGSIDNLSLISDSAVYYAKLLDVFLDWELFDNVGVIHSILINLDLILNNIKK
jgi:hypothetical protein